MNINRYNLRVYGLLKNEDKILITHENRAGILMTKFPGGGLEMGEGLADCLVREFEEELKITVSVGELFYVNEFMQISEFNKTDQLISFYYWVETDDLEDIPTQEVVGELKRAQQVFEWRKISSLKTDHFTFPIDKIVSERLQQI